MRNKLRILFVLKRIKNRDKKKGCLCGEPPQSKLRERKKGRQRSRRPPTAI